VWAEASELLAFSALLVSLVAFMVAVADWLQIGREEAWAPTWAGKGTCILKRQHYWPVWTEGFLDFHGGQVSTVNDAGFPAQLVHRNESVVVQVSPTVLGTVLHVFARRATIEELVRQRLFRLCMRTTQRSDVDAGPRFNWLYNFADRHLNVQNRHWSFDAVSGKKAWPTPIVHMYESDSVAG
jgi:hypothetical protein